MNPLLKYVIVAIIMFGVLIAVHELGHFLSAKLLGVKVNEFAIGMGPRLFHRKGKETEYSLRLLPIGGFCAMEGEDEASGDPKAFCVQPAWKKFIILIAGSFMNLVTGFLIILIIFSQVSQIRQPVISGFMEGCPYESANGLQAGDRILQIDGEHVYIYNDIALLFSRSNGETVNFVVERNGEKVVLNDFSFALREYTETDGTTITRYGLLFDTTEPATIWAKIQQSGLYTVDVVRTVRMSLTDLVTGAVGLRDLSGPVGIVDMMSQVGSSAATATDAVLSVLSFSAMLAVNLAVMNLLPIPALDGGRIFFLVVNGIYTMFTRKKLNPKYENALNAGCFMLLLALMAVVAVSDVLKIVGV